MLRLEHIIFSEVPMADLNLTEKVSVNVNTSTLSQIDLLVDNGYYSNRSDFINHALRVALDQQNATVERLIARNDGQGKDGKQWFLGIFQLTAGDVNRMFADNERITVSGYGIFAIDEYVDEQKLFDVLHSIDVKGKVICNKSVKEHYGLK